MKITLLKYGLTLGIVVFLSQKLTETLSLEQHIMLSLAALLFLLFGYAIGTGFNSQINSHYRNKLYLAKLTTREKDVAQLIVQGLSNKEICDKICVEASTLKTHINKIYQKCEASSRREFKEKLATAFG